MSNGTPNDAPLPAPGERTLSKAGRPGMPHEAIVATICASIKTDGIADAKAALLAGISTETLRQWKLRHPACALKLAQARAEFHRARLAEIRGACSRDGSLDWRAQAWLLEHTGEEEEAAETGKAKAKVAESPAVHLHVVITPENLQELQRRRAAALKAAQN